MAVRVKAPAADLWRGLDRLRELARELERSKGLGRKLIELKYARLKLLPRGLAPVDFVACAEAGGAGRLCLEWGPGRTSPTLVAYGGDGSRVEVPLDRTFVSDVVRLAPYGGALERLAELARREAEARGGGEREALLQVAKALNTLEVLVFAAGGE